MYLGAQVDYKKTYDEFNRQAVQQHAAFTDTVNLAFAKALEEAWTKYQLQDGITRQVMPEPMLVPVLEGEQTEFMEVHISETVDTLPKSYPLETERVIFAATESSQKVLEFRYFDALQRISVPKEYGSFHPKGISEKDVAAFWRELSRYDYTCILADCEKYSQEQGLNDWAVLEWVQALSAALFPNNYYSEQTIFTVFLLNQMGLMTKVARADERLVSLFSSRQPVYARKFIQINSNPYYLAEKQFAASTVYTYDTDFIKQVQPVDLRINVAPALGESSSFKNYQKQSRLFRASWDIPVNQALIRFYEMYPQTSLQVYASARPESRFSAALEKGLKERMKGLSEEETINKLLTFVQTEFSYKTDMDQFQYEKPFFFEENFVYEHNDCEDRAVLFVHLVKALTGCPVVLLEYPDHVAAAVHLKGDVKGDHVRIKDFNYYICDPSFIGASVGMTMTKYKNVAVKVYAL